MQEDEVRRKKAARIKVNTPNSKAVKKRKMNMDDDEQVGKRVWRQQLVRRVGAACDVNSRCSQQVGFVQSKCKCLAFRLQLHLQDPL